MLELQAVVWEKPIPSKNKGQGQASLTSGLKPDIRLDSQDLCTESEGDTFTFELIFGAQ